MISSESVIETPDICDVFKDTESTGKTTILLEKPIASVRNDTYVIKKTMGKIWTRKLNERKQAFWNELKNMKRSQLYEDSLNDVPVYIPKPFKYRPLPTETPKQKEMLTFHVLVCMSALIVP